MSETAKKPAEILPLIPEQKDEYGRQDALDSCRALTRLQPLVRRHEGIIRTAVKDVPEFRENCGFGFGRNSETGEDELFTELDTGLETHEKPIFICNQATVYHEVPKSEALVMAFEKMHGAIPEPVKRIMVHLLDKYRTDYMLGWLEKHPEKLRIQDKLDELQDELDQRAVTGEIHDLPEELQDCEVRETRFGDASIDIRMKPPGHGGYSEAVKP